MLLKPIWGPDNIMQYIYNNHGKKWEQLYKIKSHYLCDETLLLYVGTDKPIHNLIGTFNGSAYADPDHVRLLFRKTKLECSHHKCPLIFGQHTFYSGQMIDEDDLELRNEFNVPVKDVRIFGDLAKREKRETFDVFLQRMKIDSSRISMFGQLV